jgi:hypothetical protein
MGNFRTRLFLASSQRLRSNHNTNPESEILDRQIQSKYVEGQEQGAVASRDGV